MSGPAVIVDTSALIRWWAKDDPVQSPKVHAFLLKARQQHRPLYLSDVVLAESTWVLQRVFKLDRPDIARHLLGLINDPAFTFDHPTRLSRALDLYLAHPLSFHDAYIAACAGDYEGSKVLSFDQDFKKAEVKMEQL